VLEDLLEQARDVEPVEAGLASELDQTREDLLLPLRVAHETPTLRLEAHDLRHDALPLRQPLDEATVDRVETRPQLRKLVVAHGELFIPRCVKQGPCQRAFSPLD